MCVRIELRARMEGLKQQASGVALQSRSPLVKSQTLGGPPIRPPDEVSCGSRCCISSYLLSWDSTDIPVAGLFTVCIVLSPQMQALPNRHAPQGHPGPTGGPSTHHQFPNHQTAPLHIVPYSVPAVTAIPSITTTSVLLFPDPPTPLPPHDSPRACVHNN